MKIKVILFIRVTFFNRRERETVMIKRTALLGILAGLLLMLALALPAQASEYNPPQSNLRPTPTVEINPDEHHHDHSNLDGPAPMQALELAVSTCSGGFAGEYPCQ